MPELTPSGITDLRISCELEPEGSCLRIVKLFKNNVGPSVAMLLFPSSYKEHACEHYLHSRRSHDEFLCRQPWIRKMERLRYVSA